MEQNRRNFLKASGLIAGGALLNPLTGHGFNSSVDETIKVALIGCGGRGTGAAAQALSTNQNVQIVAMADAFKDRLDESYKNLTAKKYKNAAGTVVDTNTKVNVPDDRKFVGFDAFQKAIALKDVDVVILATPPGFRPSHFEEAVKNNKHIFMEKPVATDAPGIRKVLELAEEAKKKKLNVVVGLQRHYQANYREAIKRIHDGAIGDIVGGQVYWVGSSPWMKERVAGQTEMEYQMRNWYYFNWLCGDHINEQHVHNIDVANWVKKGYPVSIQGTGGRQVRTGKAYGEIFDHHTLDLTYADGTVISSQCRQFEGTWNKVDEAFVGTKGRIDSFDGKKTALKDYKGGVIYQHDDKGDKNPYQVEHDELFAAIAKGEYKFADAENGAKSTMTAIMGRMATYSGKMIKWDEALNSDINLFPDKLAWDASPKVLPGPDGLYPVAIPGKTQVI
ncbi:Gfo/Idh/MocA family protein [Dyadobacter sediminis]|uniref:Gfo/Idh/MocA family oxidoreductase n=1 Tax=Dyadobacter sediminis TaxID=1493691 RepID=A0A5R9K718_9BACT|nr:Gfo/Idh/MocA family oxidoreductase [Dyadobacter sediminis]TLU89577.1 Gfo/Idh/MocA family oxidoreductase [Dyadobacter sediminis]GGC04184.1 dehydrogenase [Dyadobacter sediminis]